MGADVTVTCCRNPSAGGFIFDDVAVIAVNLLLHLRAR